MAACSASCGLPSGTASVPSRQRQAHASVLSWQMCGLDLFAGSSFAIGSRARRSCAMAPCHTLPQPARSGVQHRRFKCHLRSPRYGDQACGTLARREPGTREGEGETTAFEWSFPRRGAGVQPRALTAARSHERTLIGATVRNGPRGSTACTALCERRPRAEEGTTRWFPPQTPPSAPLRGARAGCHVWRRLERLQERRWPRAPQPPGCRVVPHPYPAGSSKLTRASES